MTGTPMFLAALAYLQGHPELPRLTGLQAHVFLVLVLHANAQSAHTRPGVERIAKLCGSSVRRVQPALRELEAKRLIELVSSGGGRERTNVWKLAPDLESPDRPSGDSGDKPPTARPKNPRHPGAKPPTIEPRTPDARSGGTKTGNVNNEDGGNESVAAAPLPPARGPGPEEPESGTQTARTATASKEAVDVAEYLRDAILEHQPENRCRRNGEREKWARDIDLAIRIDGRTVEGLKAAIDFAHRRDHDPFWRANLQSGRKLRNKYDTLEAQAARERRARPATRPQNAAAVQSWLERHGHGRS